MQITVTQPGSINIKTPAKLNLFLDCLGKRPDGYHQVSTVVCLVGLWDEIEVQATDDAAIKLELILPVAHSNDPAWSIPADSSNLVCKAAAELQRRLGSRRGCHIRLKKAIPGQAGLGGGSSNAAGTLVACMLLWDHWNRRLANEICSQLGSDLNLFLGLENGMGWVKASGRGELIEPIAVPHSLIADPPQFWLLHPPLGCSTAAVYQRVERLGDFSKTEEFLAACQTGQDSKIGAGMFNALQLPAAKLNHWIDIQLELLAECGCQHPLMSGSGSSCFGIAPRTGGTFEHLVARANQIGIQRVFKVNSWFGRSIEDQLAECRL
jgi:4-diphosphocytidyl-2-C-methyl-D-erythritol kinase